MRPARKPKKPQILPKKISESVNEKAKYSKSKTPHFLPKDYNLKKTFNPFNKFTEKKSDNINSAYNLMFKGKQFQFATRIAKKENHDYFKQFFFLLFQSMKMNSENIGNFLGFNPEKLYNECRKEHIPFHKFQKWIEKKLLKKERIENIKKYEDFKTITGIFCSSLI